MTDLFGFEGPKQDSKFVDIRNTRDSVAEEKAEMFLKLNELIRRVPKSIASASVNKTRGYLAERERAKKVLCRKSSSRTELLSAINSMLRFEHDSEG